MAMVEQVVEAAVRIPAAPMLRLLACLVAAAALTGTVVHAASGTSAACQPTLSDGAGPFQQSGLAAPRRAKIGTGHVLQGRVLGTDCRPVAGALVVLWQAGPNGYGPRGRASVRTDRSGRFRFEGPVPASYGHVPHIHIAVFKPAFEELLTRYVVRRGSKTGRVTLVLTPLL
jgi:protocatechuate 3,4-dioxygenase beta subunit